MVRFHIQADSDIPASTQLYNQIQFAIASRRFLPGHKLPSTRQLAMETGLHRNTISKVYRQLEDEGIVEALAGSGIYVRARGEAHPPVQSALMVQYPQAHALIQQSLNQLLHQGCSLHEARELFLAEMDWRLRCSARVLVTAPAQDIGAGELMAQELQAALKIPVQVVPLEELAWVLEQTRSGTVVTTRYFIGDAEAIATPRSVRVIPIDISDYRQELQMLFALPDDTCLGLVSLSPGLLRAAEVIIHSLRGERLLTMSSPPGDGAKLGAMVRFAHTIACFDQGSYNAVKGAIATARETLIRPPQVIDGGNYISGVSIDLLKRELGLTP